MEKKTPLYEEHVKAGARIVPFGGFLMPIQYSGILEEHRGVRQRLGMFDLSHMGELRVSGHRALSAIDRLVTNDVEGLSEQQIRYTPMCYPDGGIVDDLLVYRFDDHVMLVVNASNIEKDLAWIRLHGGNELTVEDVSDETALIAIQGPRAEPVVQSLTDVALSEIEYYHFALGQVGGVEATISRTGYTGEDGFELYVRGGDAPGLWQTLMAQGQREAMVLAGLGARDTLRLEAGLMLYGNDIDEHTSPLEAGLGWTVKFGASDFIGRDILERQKSEGLARRMVAVDMEDRAIPRPHFPLYVDGGAVGEVTSGTFSPTLERGIGLGYVKREHASIGTELQVEVRQQHHPARVARKPMHKREGA